MQLSDIRLLVKDFDKCLKFYTEKLGFERLFNTDGFEGFKVSDSDNDDNFVYLSIFVSDYMAATIGNADKNQPTDCREKMTISFEVKCVDTTYEALKAKGVAFINEPTDWECAGMRVVHLHDPEENLIELRTSPESGKKVSGMKLESVCLLVKDHKKCVEFYEKLDLKKTYDEGGYASFHVSDNIEGLELLESDLNAKVVGNADKKLPIGTEYREKSMISFYAECVDTTYEALKAKGIEFINEPFDWTVAHMRAVHLRDPEGNLVEIHTALACEEGRECS